MASTCHASFIPCTQVSDATTATKRSHLIHLLNGGAAATGCSISEVGPRHAARHTATATCRLVHLHHDGVHDSLQLLLLGLKLVLLSQLVLVEPIQCLLNGLFNLVLVTSLELVLQLLFCQGVAHGEAVVLQAVLGLNLGLVRLIFCAILLCLLHHAINLCLRQAALLVRDGDLVGLACGLILC
mmetsp:Transcript_6921/g.9599  ORF Transcript_6921/g.9599 Transcript_6921/m.9599 type:complete len:184 (+) Transcript_6921:89-640(+)